ncbi:MAG: porin [Pseudomonas marincola]
MKLKALIPSLSLFVIPSLVFAADDHDHNHGQSEAGFYGHLDLKIQYDHVYNAGETDEEIDEAYSHSHLELGYGFGNGISINTNLQLEGEPAGHDHGGGGAVLDGSNRYFKDEPLLARTLTVNYDGDNFGVYAGKFDPVISFDEHVLPGIYGYQVIDEYTVREKIGLGGYGKLKAGDLGTHQLDVSTFFADTTVLSNSILYERGDTDKEDGGVSNTEDFSSVAISLAGSDFYSLASDIPEGLSYRIGFAYQAAGEGDEEDETRYSLSGQYEHIFTSALKGRVVGEIVHIDHLGGEGPHDRTYSTAGAELNYKNWELGSTYTHIYNDNPEEADEALDGELFQVSLSYHFDVGFYVGAGYRYQDEEGEENKRVGMLVGYSHSF